MAWEYLRNITVPGSTSIRVPIQYGSIKGVYATGEITIGWEYNGADAEIMTGKVWEPPTSFTPAPFSKLILTNAGADAVTVGIRATNE